MATATKARKQTKAKEHLEDVWDLDELKISPEIAWYLKSRGYEKPNCPPKLKTPEPRDEPGAYFDPFKVDHVVKAFSLLQHTTGKWKGRPIILRAWQIAYLIGPTYGWVAPDEEGIPQRIIRHQFLDIPRKNAKTTIGGGQCIYLTCADGEPGAQVYALATTKDQAKFCFNPVKQLARQSPSLKGRVKAFAERIEHPKSDSVFQVMANVSSSIHGASPSGAFVDEVHLHVNWDLIEAIDTGTGARSQPLIMYATTADTNIPNSPYDNLRTKLEELCEGVIKDPTFYGVVFGADDDDDPFAVETMLKANPGTAAGDSPTLPYLKAQAHKAQSSPQAYASYLRLHLGLRTKQETKYISLQEWDQSAGMVDESALVGKQCVGGLDLGNVADLTALCWVFPDKSGGYDVIWRFFLPEEQVKKLDKRTSGAMSGWIKKGLVKVTPGATTDYDYVIKQIKDDRKRFKVKEIGFDPWNANQLTKQLQEERAPLVEVRQGYVTLSPALKECKRLLVSYNDTDPPESKLRSGGNPVMRWMTNNLLVAEDPSGNVKPDKAHAADKIDGWSALVTGMSRAMKLSLRKSAYSAENQTNVKEA